MVCSVRSFGFLPTGEETHLYTLTNSSGASVSVSDFGATLVSCCVPDKNGTLADVSLGFEDVTPYTGEVGSIGGICGRYANRIARGELILDGKAYTLPLNDGNHHLHGGTPGFHQRLWTAQVLPEGLLLTLLSPDGENGYPGTVRASVLYAFTDDNTLRLTYGAESDAPTVINLTCHAYWSMDGADGRSARDNLLIINAARFTPITDETIPDGRFLPVEGAVDFRTEKSIADGLKQDCDQLRFGHGYDINYILDGEGMKEAATLTGPVSGRRMRIFTTEPGMQLYSGNYLGGWVGKGGIAYTVGTGVALETQHFPDTPHHPDWPSVRLTPDKPFSSVTEFRFDTV